MNTIWQEELFEDHKTGKYLRYLSHTAAGELDHGRAIAAHIVAPQCHADTWFELFETLIDFARQQAVRPDVDPAAGRA